MTARANASRKLRDQRRERLCGFEGFADCLGGRVLGALPCQDCPEDVQGVQRRSGWDVQVDVEGLVGDHVRAVRCAAT